MSRSRKVDPAKAIEAAKLLFWQHGYHGLSTRQIEEQTGLTRFTLQTSYGGKKSLFLQALDEYLNDFSNYLFKVGAADFLERVAAWFEARANPEKMPPAGNFGCFMLNTTIEFVGQDDDINVREDRYMTMLRDGFSEALGAAKKQGPLSVDFNIAEHAELLLGLALGLNVVIRASANTAAGADLAASSAAMVRSWRK
jgi:TetR/AcrR family transcriptional repressor of nem operon